MSSSKVLQPVAFWLPRDGKGERGGGLAAHPCWVLPFPEELKSQLREAMARQSRRPAEKCQVPVQVLNQAARLLIPDLISITSNAMQQGQQPWLYGFVNPERPAEPPTDSAALRYLLAAWARLVYRPPFLDRVMEAIQRTELAWRREEIDLCHWSQAPNGTARPYRESGLQRIQDGFVLLPDVVAARLCQHELSIEHGRRFRFKRAPLAPGRHGCELVSWPPQREDDGQVTWYWSLLVTITLQTVPFQSYPQLHLKLGVRRWVSAPLSYSPGRQACSIYLLDSLPWLPAGSHSQSFQVAPIEWCASSKDREGQQESDGKDKGGEFCWRGKLVELLQDQHLSQRLPDPMQLVHDPTRFLEREEGGPVAALVFRQGMKPRHPGGTGMSLLDRCCLVEHFSELLAPDFVLRPELERFAPRLSVVRLPNPFFASRQGSKKKEQQKEQDQLAEQADRCAERRRAVAEALDEAKALTLIIRYQSQQVRQALYQALHELFGYPLELADGATWTSPELALTVRSEPLGPVGRPLGLKEGARRQAAERWRQAIEGRAAEIAAALPKAVGCCGVLIELDNAEAFRQDGDPKVALRLGFGRQGYLTQFLTPEDEPASRAKERPLPMRARMAVLDLLRQFGVLGACPRIVPKATPKSLPLSIPEPLHYLATWLIYRNQRGSETHLPQCLPLVLYMRSDRPLILVRAPGFADWLPYREAALRLVHEKQSYVASQTVWPFLLKTLTSVLPSLDDTILFCDACNLRRCWPWLSNEQITCHLPPELQGFPQLRIVRIRSAVHEVPEGYVINRDLLNRGRSPYIISQGVFLDKENPHVFASVQEKPPSAQTRKASSKLSLRERQSAPGKGGGEEPFYDPQGMAWNPHIIELTVACERPDDRLMCAVVAHELRNQVAVQFGAPTVLPLPLHLARQLNEYIVPLVPPDELGEDPTLSYAEGEDEEEEEEGERE
ncbi:pPIWI_RE module domain-containing protein [Thermogemmatispora sp.]|uniref:pPIWI_RE module domain-containing protein n=1 Tax=Thermogemmatispora sp. TaxID=1968838 RepID=UPI0035E44D4D